MSHTSCVGKATLHAEGTRREGMHIVTSVDVPSARAAMSPGVPQAMATDRKAVYMAPM